jgi:hypothetical protein
MCHYQDRGNSHHYGHQAQSGLTGILPCCRAGDADRDNGNQRMNREVDCIDDTADQELSYHRPLSVGPKEHWSLAIIELDIGINVAAELI